MSFNFGSTAVAAPAASSGFSFGANTAAPAASTGGGGFSFGGASTAAAPAASGGFSFGAQPATATSTAPSTGGFSFGAQPAAAPVASTGFGGFGSTATTAPASSGGFSFGAAAPATSTGSSLFGGGATTGTTTSLFGSGASTGSSLFGGGAATTTPSTLGGFGGFGAQPQQQQQQQQQQPAQPAITLETKFDTLPADVKKNITDFHKFLKDEDQSDAFLKSVSARKLEELKSNLDQLSQDVLVRRNFQDRQATSVHHVRKDVKHLIHQVDTATLNLRSMSGESTSQKFYGIMRRVEMPSPYYWELLDSFEARMEQIKTQIEQVEAEYQPLYERQKTQQQRRGADAYSSMDPARLQQLMLAQNNALIQVAAHVAEVHEKTEEMRQAFIRKMKDDLRKHGETNPSAFKNPFDKKKRSNASRESDIDNIRFKTSVAPTIVATQQPPQAQAQPAAATTGFGFGNTTTAGGFGSTTAAGGFGSTTGSSLFGSTAAKPTISTGTSLFGSTATPAATTAAPAATGSGFNFGATNTAATQPKQVSFSLGGSTPAPTVSTGFGAAPSTTSTGFGFGAPATPAPGAPAAGGFGSVSSSFLPAGTPAFGAGAATGDKRAGGSSMRARQKKRN